MGWEVAVHHRHRIGHARPEHRRRRRAAAGRRPRVGERRRVLQLRRSGDGAVELAVGGGKAKRAAPMCAAAAAATHSRCIIVLCSNAWRNSASDGPISGSRPADDGPGPAGSAASICEEEPPPKSRWRP